MGHIIVTHETDFPIQPKDIDMSGHFFNAFDNNETEVSAKWIIRLCQLHGDWRPFLRSEIEALYNQSGYKGFAFNWLIEPGFVDSIIPENRHWEGGGWIVEKDGKLHVTDDFILRCYRSGYRNLKAQDIEPPVEPPRSAEEEGKVRDIVASLHLTDPK